MMTYNAEQLSDYLDIELTDEEISLTLIGKFTYKDINTALKEEYIIGNMITKNELLLEQISKQLGSNNIKTISKNSYLDIFDDGVNDIETTFRL